jgi:predicted TIM-barrel fold metal-dependent hydrolase
MLIDSHAHIFPFLGSAAGFPSVADHMRMLQLYMVGHGQPVRRQDDHTIMPAQGLTSAATDGPAQLSDVGFHVEENGRFVWQQNDAEVYMHFMPPSLQTNAAPPPFLLAQMAYVDVDVAVLQNAHLYGRLNEYFAAAVARYPGKFIGLAAVDEPHADDPAEIRSLCAAVRELGLRGLYYANRSFYFSGYDRYFDHPAYHVFWEAVRDLGIPVFWELAGVPVSNQENYVREIARLNTWAERYPDIPSILTHGISPAYLEGNIPEPLVQLMRNEQFAVEILYPIGWGRTHAYPYPELRPALRELYRRLGGQRLVWGSDMPNVERHCTYRQSLDYLEQFHDFIPAGDMGQILGGNLATLFGLA